VQKTTQALQAVKGPENTFDGNTKWARKDGKVLAHLVFPSKVFSGPLTA
jgi:hypothetical protein